MATGVSSPAKLCAEVIEEEIRRRHSVRVNTTVLETVKSTNSWLMARCEKIPDAELAQTDLWLCATEHQTAGRGRRGKVWHSPWGGVTFSIGFTVPVAPSEVGGMSLLTGAAVCDCLRQWSVNQAMIKWPNDILIGDAKLVGILVEIVARGQSKTRLIVGIGVNYRRGAEQKEIDQASTDLHDQCGGTPPDRSVLIGHLAAEVYQRCCSGNVQISMANLSAEWPHYDAFADTMVELKSGSSPGVQGQARGIDSQGRLLLRTAEGMMQISSGEVSVRRQR